MTTVQPPKEVMALVDIYTDLMSEIKFSVQILAQVLTLTKQKQFPVPATVNFGYQQIRLICEMLAFACLSTNNEHEHESVIAAKKERRPELMLDLFMALPEDHYPIPTKRPLEIMDMQKGRHSLRYFTKPETSPYLRKSDLLKVWQSCDDKLHCYEKLSPDRDNDMDPAFRDYTKRIMELLTYHRILVGAEGIYALVADLKQSPESFVTIAFPDNSK